MMTGSAASKQAAELSTYTNQAWVCLCSWGRSEEKKEVMGLYLHFGLSYVCSVIPAGMCHFHTKKAQNQTHPVIQTVFKISSADKENKYFVHHLWIVKGLFHFQPRHISTLFIYLFICLFVYFILNTIMRQSTRVCSLPIWMIPKESSCILCICLFLLGLTQY